MRICASKKSVGLRHNTALIIGTLIAHLPFCHLLCLAKSIVTSMSYIFNVLVSQPNVHVTSETDKSMRLPQAQEFFWVPHLHRTFK